MKRAFLNHVVTFLPETVIGNQEIIGDNPAWSVEKVFDKLGFKERRVTKEFEFASDLGVGAVKKLLEKVDVSKEIDFILYCTQSPDYLIPSNAFLLHNHFGFSKKVGALDFNLGCSGYVYGLGLAKSLIISGQAKNILLVTAETYSKILAPEDTSNRLIFGDGASASIISDSPSGSSPLRIDNFKYGTDGTGWNKLMSGLGGIRGMKASEISDLYLKMNGQEVLLFTLKEIPTLVKDLIEANNIKEINDVNHYVFHQANKFVVDQISKKLGLNSALVRNNMDNYSNTVSATIPIVLEDLLLSNSVKENESVALVGFGVGFSWAGTILTR